MKPVDVIEVLILGKRVGAATADPALGCYAFEYEPSWKRQNIVSFRQACVDQKQYPWATQ